MKCKENMVSRHSQISKSLSLIKSSFKNKVLISLPLIFLIMISNFCSFSKGAQNQYPIARYGHQLVYLPNEDQFLLYGGEFEYRSDLVLNQTWLFSPQESKWEIIPASPSPPPRMNHGMVYCPNDDVILLFGGVSTSTYNFLGDTWIFHLQNSTWELLDLDYFPSERGDMGMYFDYNLDAPVLFGGFINSGHAVSNMWYFNITEGTWNEIDLYTRPRARYGHEIIWDSINSKAIMFGGRVDGIISNEMWEFYSLNSTWIPIINQNTPIRRYWHNMATLNSSTEDTPLNAILVFGGVTGDVTLGDTYLYNTSSKNWTQLEFEEVPVLRKSSDMAERPGFNEIYLLGGTNNQADSGLTDFWKFNGASMVWEKIYDEPPDGIITGFDGIFTLFGSIGGIGISYWVIFRTKKRKST